MRLHVLTRKTLGGLHTDLSSRVLGASGDPVPGLYAAGEAAGFGGGGMHGYRSLEGTFLGGCLFSGRIAGRAAGRAATAVTKDVRPGLRTGRPCGPDRPISRNDFVALRGRMQRCVRAKHLLVLIFSRSGRGERVNVLELSRWQFGITTVYHFLFVPITIGLGFLVAGFETAWVRTGRERWLRLTKFYGKLFLINFALGVVTGIVQEFQFGMNWSAYSRQVGNIFGAPLAIEALLAFFLESTFLGLWIFGWDRLSPRLHAACMWIAATGTLLSAYFILTANAWMQHPVGSVYNPKTGQDQLTSFAEGAVQPGPARRVPARHRRLRRSRRARWWPASRCGSCCGRASPSSTRSPSGPRSRRARSPRSSAPSW